MNNFDLDQYNITSDDLRSSKSRFVRGKDAKGHPLVPKLDFTQIIADQMKTKAKPAKESGSSSGSEEDEVEIEESLMEENHKHMFQGTPILSN